MTFFRYFQISCMSNHLSVLYIAEEQIHLSVE